MLRESRKTWLAVLALASLMAVGCSQLNPDTIITGKTGWKVARDQNNVPTKIKYSHMYEHNSGTSYYWVYLYNGYDKPVKVAYKLYFAGSAPQYYEQYVFTKKETLTTTSSSEPAKVEIVKIVEQ